MLVEWIWWCLRLNFLFLHILYACVLCFLRLLLCLLSHIHIFGFIEVMITNLLFDHIHLFSIFCSCIIWTVYCCLENLLMISSYTPRNYSDFSICFLPLYLCLQIAAYFCCFFPSTGQYQIPGRVMFCLFPVSTFSYSSLQSKIFLLKQFLLLVISAMSTLLR